MMTIVGGGSPVSGQPQATVYAPKGQRQNPGSLHRRLRQAAHREAIRAGISRVEVIVILLIVSVLAGLFLVVLIPGRENAKRLRCQNHLRDLGQGITVYHNQEKYLPPSHIARGYASWAVLLAPYLPQYGKTPLQSWDLQLSYYAQQQAVRTDSITLYFCPARRVPPQNSSAGDVPSQPGWGEPKNYSGAVGDYASASGDGAIRDWDGEQANGAMIPARVLTQEGDRIMKWRGRISFSDLKRGKSVTVLLGEKHVPEQSEGLAAVGDGSLYNGDHPASFARLGGPGFPIAPSPTSPFQHNFGSAHPGVCFFLMADGHAEPLTPALSLEVLAGLVKR